MRTGTTSLTKALQILGFDAVHATCEDGIHTHEASTDTPVACRFEELWKQYPNAKFIYTVRHTPKRIQANGSEAPDPVFESWLTSMKRHSAWLKNPKSRNNPAAAGYIEARQRLGLDQPFDRETYTHMYYRHNLHVATFFSEKKFGHPMLHGEPKLLVINFFRGQGWGKLCAFLGKPVPDLPFPYLNKGVI